MPIGNVWDGVAQGFSDSVRNAATLIGMKKMGQQADIAQQEFDLRKREADRQQAVRNKIQGLYDGYKKDVLGMKAVKAPEWKAPPDNDIGFEEYLKKHNVTDARDPNSHYDYYGAYKAGVVPKRWEDLPEADRQQDIAQGRDLAGKNMWPDDHKTAGHPYWDSSIANIDNKNPDALKRRGQFISDMRDVLYEHGDIKTATGLTRVELANMAELFKLSPKKIPEAWNSSFLAREYGEMKPEDVKTSGKKHMANVPGFGTVIYNDETGEYRKIADPKQEITSQMTLDASGKRVWANKDGTPSGLAAVLPKEIYGTGSAGGKGKELTMNDVKSAYAMDIGNLKEQIKIAMTPDELMKGNFDQLTPEQMLSMVMSGNIKSIPREKAQYFQKELASIHEHYGNLSQQVLGRKGAIGGARKAGEQTAVASKGAAAEAAPYGTYGDLYKIVTDAGSSTAAIQALKKKGYSDTQAKEIIRQGIEGGYIR